MSSIELRNVSTPYSLNNINLKVEEGELMVVLGPTGAGKTTLLNVIAGLEKYQGTVCYGHETVDHIPVERRNIGYLFQDLCLFPHLNVYKNVAFALLRLKWSPERIENRVEEILSFLGISRLKERYPRNLSGGEKQRVALARALAGKPQILLFDEPLSSLDNRTSKHLITEVHHLVKNLGLTTIYVTHTFYEAEKLADRIAILDNGCLEQVGTVEEVFFNPADKVKDFIGAPNILDCESCYPIQHGLMIAQCGDISLVMSNEGYQVRRIAILPEDLYLTAEKPDGPGLNTVKGVLKSFEESSYTVSCTVQVGSRSLKAKLPREIFNSMYLKFGDPVWLIFNLRKLKVASDTNSGAA